MRMIHRLIRDAGRELLRVPRPLAYNGQARLKASLGPTLAYFKLTRPDFFFVQVGAHDGKMDDPIHPFVEQFRLPGLVVEPQPELFAALKQTYAHRPDIKFENAAITGHDGRITMHRVRPSAASEKWVTGTASLKADMLDPVRKACAGDTETHRATIAAIEEIQVNAVTPATLLARHGVARFDLLQIDVQGMDYEVLKLFDVKKSQPAVIHFEHNMLAWDDWEECLGMLIDAGYLISHTYEDTLACLKDAIPAP